MNNKIASKTKSAFRSQFGQIFGPVFTNHSNSLALLDFNQPCIFCSADSGEIPGIYSTALLMDAGANKNNISSSTSGNKFTLKPVDWITMMMNDTGFERRFNDFLELLEEDRKGNTKTENDDVVSICPYSLMTASSSSPSSKPVLQRKSDWSSTELIQWNIRSFVLATNLAYSFHSVLCSNNEQHRNVIASSIPPSARWIHNLFSSSSTIQKRETPSTTTSQLLLEAYNALLEEQRADSGLYFMLPPLESLVASWNIVQRYGFGVVQIQHQQQERGQNDQSSSIYPTLAPLVSTDFLDRSLQKTTETSQQKQTKPVSSGWSGIKGIKMRNSEDDKKKVSSSSLKEQQESPRLRLMTIPQIVQDSRLMSKISFNEDESEQDQSLTYVGTRCKKYYLPDAFMTRKKQTDNDDNGSQFNMNSMVGSERWFLVAEK